MPQYIALIRGVNVGGKNKVSMQQLKALFIENGLEDVITYINSGNIIFSTSCTDTTLLKLRCEAFILEKLQLNLSLTILPATILKEALAHLPQWWGADENSKHNAIFVIPPLTAQEVIADVGEIKPEYENIFYFNNIIFWSAPLKTYSRTRWAKVSEKNAYKYITIRNFNTTIKLSQLCK